LTVPKERTVNRELKFRLRLGSGFSYWGFVEDDVFAGVPVLSGASMSMRDVMQRSQQYTGIKDRNGVEIYEGDIVVTWFPSANDLGVSGNAVVRWDAEFAMFVMKATNGSGDEQMMDVPCRVIGNVCENPELLQ